jgi:hypothetical protein
MATYTAANALKKISTGDESGTWGDSTNNNFDIIDRASNGFVSIALSSTSYTLELSTTAVLSNGHYKAIKFTGTPSDTCTVTLQQNDKARIYMILNSTNQSLSITQGSGANVTILSGKSAIVLADGAGSSAAVTDFTSLIETSELDVTAGTVSASKAVVVDSDKDITDFRNVTLTGELDAATLDISGAGDIDGALDVGGALTNSSVAVKVAGLETIYVPATAMYPNTTSGCAFLTQVELANGPELRCLDFDASSAENAQFTVCFPKSWNEGTITFQAFWTVTGTDNGTVAWGLSGVSIADDVSINTAFGTNVVATAKAFSGTSNDMTVSAVSGPVTVASAAVDTQTYFQVMRDVSADSQAGDARLLGIKLFFTTDAKNDA